MLVFGYQSIETLGVRTIGKRAFWEQNKGKLREILKEIVQAIVNEDKKQLEWSLIKLKDYKEFANRSISEFHEIFTGTALKHTSLLNFIDSIGFPGIEGLKLELFDSYLPHIVITSNKTIFLKKVIWWYKNKMIHRIDSFINNRKREIFNQLRNKKFIKENIELLDVIYDTKLSGLTNEEIQILEGLQGHYNPEIVEKVLDFLMKIEANGINELKSEVDLEKAFEEIKEKQKRMRGLILNNEYEIIDDKGTGATADTYLVETINTNKQYALKIYNDWVLSQPDQKKRLEREVEKMSGIDHPNLMKVYEIKSHKTEENLYTYLVMEYLDGITLKDFIKESVPLELEEIFNILYQICEGLKVLHKKDIIHRDLKPENIMIVQENDKKVIKIMDFGVIKDLKDTSITESGKFLGTIKYASPEWILGNKITDEKTDLYSVGAILYKLLTGKDPFHDKKNTALIIQELPRQDELDQYNSRIFRDENIRDYPKFLIRLGLKLTMHPSERPSIAEIMEVVIQGEESSFWKSEKRLLKNMLSPSLIKEKIVTKVKRIYDLKDSDITDMLDYYPSLKDQIDLLKDFFLFLAMEPLYKWHTFKRLIKPFWIQKALTEDFLYNSKNYGVNNSNRSAFQYQFDIILSLYSSDFVFLKEIFETLIESCHPKYINQLNASGNFKRIDHSVRRQLISHMMILLEATDNSIRSRRIYLFCRSLRGLT